ncbi:hypothetical protein NPIL_142061 [Nephila pilipes]|uniref:Uncharacterized protein n=1 Tax=Nephila pilipes TaxID=299642 RepID=A0A8X6NY20_NEPPI|nr:hypothetical protein NPIL_142061 [Nephila pilipes]
MAIQCFFKVVSHLLQSAVNYVLDFDLMFFFEIFVFEVVMEFFKYLTVKQPLSSPSETEPFAPFDQNVTNSGKKKTPVVRSKMIFRMCQALEMSVELAPFEESSAEIQTPLRRERKIAPLPAVYSITVLKLCQALDLKAELRPQTERPNFGNGRKKPLPVVRSSTVFYMCRALALDVQLAEI